MYKLVNIFGVTHILRLADNAMIPPEIANSDYRAYLEWVDEGNEPLPADEPTSSV